MEAFINEKSLHAQFSAHNIEQEIIEFVKVLKLLNEIEPKFITLKSVGLFNSQALPGTHFNATLKSNQNLSQILFANLRNTVNWNDNQKHDNQSTYTYNNIDYKSFSVAEISERKISQANHHTVLVNFSNSTFGTTPNIDVTKNEQTVTEIPCAYSAASLKQWLEDNGLIDPTIPYNNSFKRSPCDHETILNTAAFEETTYKRNQGRRVFRRIGTNELWAVDRKHRGDGAHIEVFSETTGKHLGTSKYNQINLETKYVRPNRTIDLT